LLKFWKNTPKATRLTSLSGYPETTKGERCFISFNFVTPMKKREERKRAKCPRCGAEYDMLDEAASKAMGGLCAACWCDRHERNIGEDREREAGTSEKTTSTES